MAKRKQPSVCCIPLVSALSYMCKCPSSSCLNAERNGKKDATFLGGTFHSNLLLFSGQTIHQSEACYTHILSHAKPHIHSCHMQSKEKGKSEGLQRTKEKKQSRYAKDKLRLVDNELKAAKAGYYQSSSNKRNSELSSRTRLLRAGLYLAYFYSM